jgi:hypothetical protein
MESLTEHMNLLMLDIVLTQGFIIIVSITSLLKPGTCVGTHIHATSYKPKLDRTCVCFRLDVLRLNRTNKVAERFRQ